MSNVMRVPGDLHAEVVTAAHMLDRTPGELLQRAWELYRQTPEFHEDFTFAQRAFASGDLKVIAARLQERGQERASRRAAMARGSETKV